MSRAPEGRQRDARTFVEGRCAFLTTVKRLYKASAVRRGLSPLPGLARQRAFFQGLAPLAKLCRPCRGCAESRAPRNRNGIRTRAAGNLRLSTSCSSWDRTAADTPSRFVVNGTAKRCHGRRSLPRIAFPDGARERGRSTASRESCANSGKARKDLETFWEFRGFFFQIATGSDCRSVLREGKIEDGEPGA